MQTTNTRDPNDRLTAERDWQSLIRFGAIFAASFFLASTMPPGLVAATLSSLLSIGALLSASAALLTATPVNADHLTQWDEAAAFVALSILVGWMVDPDALSAAASAGA